MRADAIIIAACVIILAGCAGAPRPAPEPVRIYTEVEIPVAVPCPEGGPPDRPDFIDDAEAIRAVDPADLAVLLYSGRLQRDEHIARLEGVMAACGRREASDLP
jgi:hypothetical protein